MYYKVRCRLLSVVLAVVLQQLLVRHVPVLDDGERIDDRALLVHGDLLKVQMRPVVRPHAGVPVVAAVDGTPVGDFVDERFAALLAAGGTCYQVNRGPRVPVGFLVRAVVDLRVIESFVPMFSAVEPNAFAKISELVKK